MATHEEIKFLNSPKIGINKRNTADSKKAVSSTSTIRILSSC
jgi:hypothetical protein